MKQKLIISFALLICISITSLAQKPKSKTTASKAAGALSNADKMGYARTNQYWGPGTYYCFAPGAPNNRYANTPESAMRDLTGISREDVNTELAKQGFVEVPKKEMKKWFNENNSKDKKLYYSADKSYILDPQIKDMYNSAKNGYTPYASSSMTRYVLIPTQDSTKVLDAIWKYLRDLNDMKVILSSFGSTFKKADPKSYPIQRAGSSGWASMRAGTFVLKMVDGKPKGYWESNEDIVRRTIGKPEFKLEILGMETDFWYGMKVNLTKEGYVLYYNVVAGTMADLEPGSNWTTEHKSLVAQYTGGVKMDKEAVDIYKKAPLPPVLMDMDKLLHRK